VTVASLPGPSRRITVEPIKQPQRAPEPKREPAKEPAPPAKPKREPVPA